MFQFVVILASLLSISAFNSPIIAKRNAFSSLKMAFENEIGALPPVGFWDPLGNHYY